MTARPLRPAVALPVAFQPAFDRLSAAQAKRLFGLAPATFHDLQHGGKARPETVARVLAAAAAAGWAR